MWERVKPGPMCGRDRIADGDYDHERPAREDGLNWLNRRVRTRMHGGVGGGAPRGVPLSRSPGFSPYALTYASSHETHAGALIETLAFGKDEMPRLGSAPPLDGAQAKHRFDSGDDHVKEKPCQAPVTDRS
jgi:hypothetical protein